MKKMLAVLSATLLLGAPIFALSADEPAGGASQGSAPPPNTEVVGAVGFFTLVGLGLAAAISAGTGANPTTTTTHH